MGPLTATGTRALLTEHRHSIATPVETRDDAESPYWIVAEAGAVPEPRVLVRFVHGQHLPLWLDGNRSLLSDLSVAKATGGSVFTVTEEQWNAVAVAAGIEPDVDARPTADASELHRRARTLRQRGPIGRPAGREKPRAVASSPATAYERDPKVRAWVLQEAHGSGELCGNEAPFVGADGEPYLEVHHPRTLAESGTDTPDNAVALCANCHRALHYSVQRDELLAALYARVGRPRRS